MLKPFKIQDIGLLDEGRDAIRINRMIRQCVEDCVNRAGLKKNRKVNIEVGLSPVAGDDQICDQVNVEIQCKVSIPRSVSKTFTMGAKAKGQLLFNAASPNDPRQMTIDETTGEVLDS